MKKEKSIGILIKTSHDCNLNCEYCFDKTNREKYKGMRLSVDDIKKTVDLVSNHARRVDWIWHGGEPMCVPKETYLALQEHINGKYTNMIEQSMQTNGSLFDEEWRDFVVENDIAVGISYDGKDSIRHGEVSKEVIADNIKAYSAVSDSAGTITVINESNYDRQIEIYEEIAALNVNSISFNHVFSTDRNETQNLHFDLDKYQKEYIKFAEYLLDNRKMLERSVKLLIRTVLGDEYHLCSHGDCRRAWLGIEPDGTVVPCDRYYPEKYWMGNVKTAKSVNELYDSPGYQLFCSEIEKKYVDYCYDCKYFFHCNGGCNADSIAKYNSAAILDEFSCKWFKKSFNATYYVLRKMDGLGNPNLHPDIEKLLVSEYRYLPKEIFAAIKRNLGIEVSLLSDEYVLNSDEGLIDSKEFKLFRLFNPFTVKGMNYGINSTGTHSTAKNKMDRRETAIDKFIQDNLVEILHIISEG